MYLRGWDGDVGYWGVLGSIGEYWGVLGSVGEEVRNERTEGTDGTEGANYLHRSRLPLPPAAGFQSESRDTILARERPKPGKRAERTTERR